jgi:hypothetical protein
MKFYYFYKVINLLNNEYYYGVHSTIDLNDNYFGSGKIIKRAINKYGINNFKREILKFFNNEEEMYKYEEDFITQELIDDLNCYNLCPGGKGGWVGKVSVESKLRGAENIRNYWKNITPEQRKMHGEKTKAGKTEETEKRRKKNREIVFSKKSTEEINIIYKKIGNSLHEFNINNPESKIIKSEKSKKYWAEHPEKRLELKENNTGYDKNKEFIKNWKFLYDSYKDRILDLVLYSNLADDNIKKLLKLPIKLEKALKYYEYLDLIKVKEILHFNDISEFAKIIKKKTLCENINYEKKEFIEYKLINLYRLNHYENNIRYALDIDYSDSYMSNYLNKSYFVSDLKYYEYLDLIKIKSTIKINIKKIFPNAQRNTAKKTIIELNKNFKQNIYY